MPYTRKCSLRLLSVIISIAFVLHNVILIYNISYILLKTIKKMYKLSLFSFIYKYISIMQTPFLKV